MKSRFLLATAFHKCAKILENALKQNNESGFTFFSDVVLLKYNEDTNLDY